MSLLADHYLGGFRRKHPYGNLQPLATPVNNRHRAVFPFRSAKDLNGSTLERMKRIEDLDFTIFWTQGIVGVGVFIPMSTASFPPVGSPPITPAGFDPIHASSFPLLYCGACFLASSSPPWSLPSNTVHCTWPENSHRLPIPSSSLPGCVRCSAKIASSTPNHPSADPSTSCSISAATLIVLPFPTIACSHSQTAKLPFAGVTLPITTGRK